MEKPIAQTDENPSADLTPEDRAAQEAALLDVFADTAETPPATPSEETPKEDATPPAEETPATTETTPEVEFVQLTKADYDKVMAAVNGMDQRFGTAFGKMGDFEKRLKTQEAARADLKNTGLQLTGDEFAEMKQDFPDLHDMLKKGFERALGHMKPGETKEDRAELVRDLVRSEFAHMANQRKAETFETMDAIREDWSKIVGIKQHDNDPLPDTPYRRWLATKPKDYQDRLANTWNAAVINKSIDLFEKETSKPAPPAKNKPTPPVSRQQGRMAAAVTPKGTGVGMGKGQTTEEDEMLAGFHGK